jgi:hypothetical protein
MNEEETYYVIYNPIVCNYFLKADPNNPELQYLRKGYYISAIPLQANGIAFKGTVEQCDQVLHSITMFVYN